MINYEKMWFALKKLVIEYPDEQIRKIFLEGMSKIEVGDIEDQKRQPPLFIPPQQIRDQKMPMPDMVVAMYAVRPIDLDRSSSGARITVTDTAGSEWFANDIKIKDHDKT